MNTMEKLVKASVCWTKDSIWPKLKDYPAARMKVTMAYALVSVNPAAATKSVMAMFPALSVIEGIDSLDEIEEMGRKFLEVEGSIPMTFAVKRNPDGTTENKTFGIQMEEWSQIVALAKAM